MFAFLSEINPNDVLLFLALMTSNIPLYMMLFSFNLLVNTYDFAYYFHSWEQGILITGPGYKYIFYPGCNCRITYHGFELKKRY